MTGINKKILALSNRYGKERKYWLEKLSGELRRSIIPYDNAETSTQKQASHYPFTFSPELCEKLMKAAKASDPRLHMLLATGLVLLLHHYTENNDIIIGMPIYRQERDADFVNTVLAIRNRLEPGITFKDLLMQVRSTIVEAAANQNYPLETLLYDLNMTPSTAEFPLFDTAILLENIQDRKYLQHIPLNLVFSFLRKNDRIEGDIQYNNLLYDTVTLATLGRYFETLLLKALKAANAPVDDIDILSAEDKKRLLEDLNDTTVEYAGEKTLHELFARQVLKTPDHPAVVFEKEELSYRELDKKTRQLAGLLVEKGVGPGKIVALVMERSPQMMVGILAVLKAGAAYLPIDPEYPAQRVSFMLRDSDTTLLLTQSHLDTTGPFAGHRLDLDQESLYTNRPWGNEPKEQPCPGLHPAYVIYTSGSTGKPKGVIVTHRAIVNTLYWRMNHYRFDSRDVILQLLSFAFDSSVETVFNALTSGARLVLIPEAQRLNINYIGECIKRNRVTHFAIIPHFYKQFLAEIPHQLKHMKSVTLGGEAFTETLVKDHFRTLPQVRLVNEYGPTENSVCTTVYPFNPQKVRILIGKPIDNTLCYVLYKSKKPTPAGVPGVLFISGPGLAQGYLNNPEFTALKFVKNPFENAKRMYCTDDVARWLPEGNLEFLGRADNQVKIRGHRIELGEIEEQLLKRQDIKNAVVITWKPNRQTGDDQVSASEDQQLCAYILADTPIDEGELREDLDRKLPYYMIPSHFIRLERFPLTSTGKIDVRSLPQPEIKKTNVYCAPRDEREKKLTAIWADVLGIEAKAIGIDDNFFQLGGHSLKSVTLVSKIHKAFDVKLALADVFKKPTIRSSAQYIKEAGQDRYESIGPTEKKDRYPLSSPQNRLYVLQQIDPDNTAYNLSQIISLQAEPDRLDMENTFKMLIRRHESLRTSFVMVNENPVQRIHDQAEFAITFYDLSLDKLHPEEANPPQQPVETQIIKSFVNSFDLTRAPLLRAALLKTRDEKYILMVDMHHIISDGISHTILVQDFLNLDKGQDLPPLRLQYKDFSQWQHSDKVKQVLSQQEKYWINRFQGEIPLLNLPGDYVRPSLQSFAGDTLAFQLSRESTLRLNQLALERGYTLFMVLLALYTVVLAKISGQEDIVIGTPIGGRRHADLEKVIGMFVNTLPLRSFPHREQTFNRFLHQVSEDVLAAFEHQDYFFEDLVEELPVNRDTSRNPIFDVMFVLQNISENTGQITRADDSPGTESPLRYEHKTAKFDLTLHSSEFQGKLLFSFEYCTRIFKKETIERYINYFRKVASAIMANPAQKLAEIEIIPEEEKNQVLWEFNKTRTNYPFDKTLQQLFAEQVMRIPDHTALIGRNPKQRASSEQHLNSCGGNLFITYNELNERSTQLARRLKEKGVRPDTIVGIMTERSNEMIVGIFGILKAGGCYLPIDPGYPGERIRFMLADSKPAALLTTGSLAKEREKVRRWPGKKIFLDADNVIRPACSLDHLSLHPLDNEPGASLAYVIYTSGSTGKPKGVLVNQMSVVNILFGLQQEYPGAGTDTYLLKTSYTFDVSVTELFGWSLAGGKLAILEKGGEKNPEAIIEAVASEHITHINFVPSMLHAFLQQVGPQDKDKLSSLKYIFLAGEALNPELVRRFEALNSGITLENLYGPTEATVYSSRYSLKNWQGSQCVPIGKPLGNINLYIIDIDHNLQPLGIVGELAIAGKGIARGYLNNPVLTNSRFQIPNPKEEKKETGERLYRSNMSDMSYIYRTGDLARWLPEGNIEFLGRIDQQVKIRGYRIELGEIKSQLMQHAEVRDAVVLVMKDKTGDKYLCAYIVAAKELSAAELKTHSAKKLPAYMIPSYFVQIDTVPLTANGKVDRKALPQPGISAEEYVAPRNAAEEKIVELWAEVLNLEKEKISIEANFFDLGGHSLKATLLISKIHKEFKVKLSLAQFFKTPTGKGISEYLQGARQESYQALEMVEKKEYYPLSSAQKRLYILQQMDTTSTGYNMPQVISLDRDIRVKRLENSFKKMIRRHESLRTSFVIIANEPVQRIHDPGDVDFNLDLSTMNEEQAAQQVKQFVTPFELSKPPLLKINLIMVGDKKCLLLMDMHHIITDGMSQEIFEREFGQLYHGEELPPLNRQYKDYAQWQNNPGVRTAIAQQETYWLKQFAGEIPVLDLPTDFARPTMQSFAGDTLGFVISPQQTNLLKQIALKQGCTLFMVLLAVYQIFLSRLTGQEDIIVGSPIAGRRHADLQNIMGMFVNSLALRNIPAGPKSVNRFIREVKENTLMAFDNQDYQFEDLVDRLSLDRDISRNPLFDVMFSLQNLENLPGDSRQSQTAQTAPTANQRPSNPYGFRNETTKFDLNLASLETGDHLRLRFQYGSKLFKKETIQRFVQYFQAVVSSVTHSLTQNPEMALSQIEILSPPEKQQLLVDFNSTDAAYPNAATIKDLFEQQADRTPDNVALVGEWDSQPGKMDRTSPGRAQGMAYRELNRKSNQLALRLREKGVTPDTLVGIMIEPLPQVVIGILAVLKAGGAYLPLESQYPGQRIAYMLADSNAPVLLGFKNSTSEAAWGDKVLYLALDDEGIYAGPSLNLTGSGSPASLVYTIYTSGTTGIPKGVALENRNLVNYVTWFTAAAGISAADKALLTSSLAFDLGYTALYPSLLQGGEFHIIPKEIYLFAQHLLNYMAENGITYIKMTPSLFTAVIEDARYAARQCQSLRLVVLGGEAINTRDVNTTFASFQHLSIMNHYGPTEATIGSIAQFIDPGQMAEYTRRPTLGKPIHNTVIYILDRYFHLVPGGVAGELCISGRGLARGYLNQPELTTAKFNHDENKNLLRGVQGGGFLEKSPPGHRRQKLYKTGDLARWLADGRIEFLGRTDHQIKIRGFRIEMGEIRHQLLNHETVKEAVIMVKKNKKQENYLMAYVVTATAMELTQLRGYLSNRLPDYMIPSYFVQLDKIPVTPNGKVDYRALPEPQSKETGSEFIPPRTHQEKILANLWSEVLGVEKARIGIEDNFFQWGGHSLKATIMVSKIHKELDVKIPLVELFKTPTINGIARFIREAPKEKYFGIKAAEKKEYHVLSSSQKRLFILQQLEVDGTGYNMPRVIPLESGIQVNRLETAFQKMIQRHESLRTSFAIIHDEPVQRIHEPDNLDFQVQYEEMSEEQAREKIKHFVTPFDLGRAPLLRVILVKIGDKKGLLLVDMHHIVTDGMSRDIFVQEFMKLQANGELPRLNLQYKDYAQWQNCESVSGSITQQEAYWLKEFSGEIPVINLPTDYARPALQSFAGDLIDFYLTGKETKALAQIALANNCTLFMVLLSLYAILLAKISSQEEIVTGTPIAGRRHADLEKIIGMFVNTLALKNYPKGERTFTGFLEEIRSKTLEAFENQEYQFEDLVENVSVQRDTSRNPLFDTMFVMQNIAEDTRSTREEEEPQDTPAGQASSSSTGKQFRYEHRTAKFDLTLYSAKNREGLVFAFEYCTKLFKRETIYRFIAYYKKIISSIITNPGAQISQIEIIPPEEKEQILWEFNNTPAGYPPDTTILHLLTGQVQQTPNHIAVVGSGVSPGPLESPNLVSAGVSGVVPPGYQHITYNQLETETNRLASQLKAKGVKPDTLVGIMADRSLEMVMAILAILKAGGAYLPIDPDFPPERIEFILADSKPGALINTRSWAREEEKARIDTLATQKKSEGVLPAPPAQPTSLAYVIYTSGSTGKPRGVMVEHRSAVNILLALQQKYPVTGSDTYLLKTSYTFDVSVTELFGWYIGGGKLGLLEKGGEKDPEAILRAIQRENITHINFVPSMFQVFLEQLNSPNAGKLSSLKYIFLAGEALNPGLVNRFKALNTGITLENLYGPTEAAVYSSGYSLQNWDSSQSAPTLPFVPIGKPLQDINLYILNRDGCLQPVGIVGELCIAGKGIARGYLNNPELTNSKFQIANKEVPRGQILNAFDENLTEGTETAEIAHHPSFIIHHSSFNSPLHPTPNTQHSTLYKTGDLARWLPDGNIEFLGRSDHQVKIRGYRIELGEIETQLRQMVEVKEAVVLVKKDKTGDKYLCAYIVSDTLPSLTGLKHPLSKTLPGYMIPSFFVPLDRLPLTPNGKIDRKALPEPEIGPDDYKAPGSALEEKIVVIWSEILAVKKEKLSIDANFFQMGGHSLKATIMVSKIHKELGVKTPLSELFKNPTVKGLAQYVKHARKEKYAGINRSEKREYFGLSSTQKRLYILQQMDVDGTGYNMPQVIPLDREMDVRQLQETFKKMIRRHESLRTSFDIIADEPVQKIHDPEALDFNVDYRQMGKEEAAESVNRFVTPFDLGRAPLLKVALIKLADQKNILVIDMHHIITDGMSQEILAREFFQLQRGETPAPLSFQYKDYAQWQNSEAVRESVQRQEAYWLNQFSEEIPILSIPTDYVRPTVQSFAGQVVGFQLSGPESDTLKQIALANNCTLFMVLVALYNIFLAKLSGQEEIIIGTPIAGRRHADLEKIIGMFVNTLALKNQPNGEKTFARFLEELRTKTLEAFENQEYQFEDLVEKVVLNRDTSRNPLFDVMFILQNLKESPGELPGPGAPEESTPPGEQPLNYAHRTAKFDLTLSGMEYAGRLSFAFEYCTKLFKRETIERFIGYYKKIISIIVKDTGIKIRDIEILSQEEVRDLLDDFNNTRTEYPSVKTLHQLFAEQVERTPDNIAVVDSFIQESYKELKGKSDGLACRLQEQGLESENLVGIMANPSLEMIAGILGILKSGGAYLPIDPDYPQERIDFMLKDSGAKVLLAHDLLKELPGSVQAKPADSHIFTNASSPHTQPHHIAYVMYTSGTTGKPKGVMVEHCQVNNCMSWMQVKFNLTCHDTVVHRTNLTFDPSVWEIFWPLANGGKVKVLSAAQRKDADFLITLLIENGKSRELTVMYCPASLVTVMTRLMNTRTPGPLLKLPWLIIGAEPIGMETVKSFYSYFEGKIVNTYGPTEGTINNTWYELEQEDGRSVVPIGKPVSNNQVYILSSNMQLLPVNVPGEICIAGDSVARGYINKMDKTAQLFRDNPFGKGKVYKTGDIGRWLEDGNIEILGRLDDQVKIRGYRIELGEIETQLRQIVEVKEAVALVKHDKTGDKYLCAYIVSDKPTSFTGLKHHLSKKLPGYMIPSFFVTLDRLPLTPNGKIDRKALPEPEVSPDEYKAPGNALEEKIAGIWSEILAVKKEKISIDANFFQLGGHSLKATIMVSKIHKEIGVRTPLGELFKSPTIKGLAQYVKHARKEKYAGINRSEKREYYGLASTQKRLFILQQMEIEGTGYNMPQVIPLNTETDIHQLQSTFKKMIRRHESLRTSFHILNDEPVQKIHDPETLDFKVDFRQMAEEEAAESVNRFVTPFDLGQAPLLKVALIKLAAQKYILVIDMHHIITDGMSQEILEKEFIQLQRGEELLPLNLQYKDYAQWQHQDQVNASLAQQEKYWLTEFPGEIPVLNLPGDYVRPAVQSFEGGILRFVLSREDTNALNQIALTNHCTLFMVLLALYNIFLAKISGQDEIIVGTPIAGRRHADLEKIIGMFVNTLALKNRPRGEKTLSRFLEELRITTLEAFENQEYQFEDLVEKAAVNRDTSRNPLFDVMFVLQNMKDSPGELQGPGSANQSPPPGEQPLKYEHRTAKFDLTLSAMEYAGKLSLAFEYCTKLFKTETITRFIAYYKKIVSAIIKEPERRLAEIEIIPETEKKQILFQYNKEEGYPTGTVLRQLFETQAEKTPDAIAMVDEHEAYSFKQLDKKSNQLAHYLGFREVRENRLVGIMTERSLDMIVGILGILKSNCGYVPINPESPTARTMYILKECNVKILLSQAHLSDKCQGFDNCLFLDTDKPYGNMPGSKPENKTNHQDFAYVIFTSGSTGKPKGVPISHANLSPLLHWGYRHLALDSTDRAIQNLSYYFDWSVWEIFITLTSGAALYIAPHEILLNPATCIEFIDKNTITVLHATPSQFQYLVGEGRRFETIKYLFIGAEKLTVDLVRRSNAVVNESCRIFNMYGPTEATIISTVFEIDRSDMGRSNGVSGVPIGKPIANAGVLVLDKYLKCCPARVSGELYISGDGIAKGYLNDPEKTFNSFIPNSYEPEGIPGGALYKTGDLVRWLCDGNIEFLGRWDHQVKIRGYRIELGEIEKQLLKHPDIKGAVVLAKAGTSGSSREYNDKFLCAYIVRHNKSSLAELKAHLSNQLPAYMIPSYFVQLDNIPLTPNGKIDMKALPGPETSGEEYEAPRSPAEENIRRIWSEVLDVEKEKISITSNFFELGGHSLKATILVSKIHKESDVKIPLVELFKNPTIKGLSHYLKKAAKEKYTAIATVEKKEYYILSSTQKRLFILQQMEEDGTGYNMPQVIHLDTEMDIRQLQETFKKMIRRHESLRTSFDIIADEPVQKIHDPETLDFNVDYRQMGEEEAAESVSRFVTPFDLGRAPLLKVTLIRLRDKKYILVMDMHHIITDGTSQEILEKEFIQLQREENLPPLSLQYKDYAQWQLQDEVRASLAQQKEYWLTEFAGEIPVLNLPGDYVRPVVQSFEGGILRFVLSREETNSLNQIALTNNCTLFMVSLALYNIFLAKISSQEEIIIGTPIAGRRHADLEKIIGMFVNTLALKNHPNGEKTFKGFLEEIRTKTLEAFENQEYQFEDLVEKVVLNRDTSRNPLFDVMFVLQNTGEDTGEPQVLAAQEKSPAAEEQPLQYAHRTAKFDLTLSCAEYAGMLELSFEYCTKLFKRETIERFIAFFKKIVTSIIENPGKKISQIEIIPEEEKKQVLYEFNDTAVESPTGKTIHQLFAEQVKKAPDHIALTGQIPNKEGTLGRVQHSKPTIGHLSYRELNENSDQLARQLGVKNTRSNRIVGIMVERSVEMVIGLLGILKAGSAYLPIDPGYPAERINYMLDDSGVKVLLAAAGTLVKAEAEAENRPLEIIDISNLLPSSTLTSTCQVNPANLAYVIYTSGSTGRPKGVLIKHQGFVNLAYYHRSIFSEGYGDHMSQVASPGFDAMAFEVWPCLLSGSTLCIVDDEVRMDPLLLKEWLIKHKITITFQSTLMGEQLLKEQWPESGVTLRALRVAGDRLSCYPTHAYPFKLYNLYGPTEDTVWTTWTEVPVNPGTNSFPPIGQPIANHRVYIMDSQFALQPVGVPGQLCIGGEGLSLGYLNRPELTNKQFCLRRPGGDFLKKVPPWTPHKNFLLFHLLLSTHHSPIYLTGDLARWLPDGNIEFLGRIDHQVKIRGYRIELAEIESQLLRHAEVKEAVVLAREDRSGDKYLCSYIVTVKQLSAKELETHLSIQLPAYMIPAHFVQLDKIPLTPNGKIDRKALPEPETIVEEYEAPRTPAEKKLAEIWAEVLDIEKQKISIRANFFQLGGHSLKATLMAAKIQKEFDTRLPLIEIFKTPTIEKLVERIQGEEKGIFSLTDDNLVLLKKKSPQAKHLFFIHDGSGEVEGYLEFCSRLENGFNCWGIRADSVEHYSPRNLTVADLAKRYIQKILKVQPAGHGPYYAAGWSIGGTIAFEVVKQLEEMGEKIGFFAMMDAVSPSSLQKKIPAPFDIPSELTFIRSYLQDSEIENQLQNATQIEQLWQTTVQYLENNRIDIHSLQKGKEMIDYEALLIPNDERLSTGESIRYMNRTRTLAKARACYLPGGKIQTPVYHFIATQSKESIGDGWKDYCQEPVKIVEINGNHFSIFKKPEVEAFAKQFHREMDSKH